jgi:hypothetical protein
MIWWLLALYPVFGAMAGGYNAHPKIGTYGWDSVDTLFLVFGYTVMWPLFLLSAFGQLVAKHMADLRKELGKDA